MGVVSKILEKKGRQAVSRIKDVFSAGPEKEPDYPLGLHQNAILRFDPTDFILAAENFKIGLPSGDISVMAIGEFNCLGTSFHRAYLKDLNDEEWILQVAHTMAGPAQRDEPARRRMAAAGKQELEVILFQTIDEVYPDDWDLWLNEKTGLIGYKDFHSPDQVEYYRVFQNPGPDWASPIEFRECVRGCGEKFFINHAMMLYSRGVQAAAGEELTEYLLVSREEDDEGVLVRIMAGMQVSPMSLTIL